MNAVFSLRMTKADLDAIDGASTNRSEWIRDALSDLMLVRAPKREEAVRAHAGKFGEGYTEFVPVTVSTDLARDLAAFASEMGVKISQVVRAAIRRRLAPASEKTSARRR